MSDIHTLGPWLRRFLSEHIVTERNLARNTQQSYRDTFALLLPFVGTKLRKPVDRLAVCDLTSKRVLQFLTHIENDRGCSVQTRNQRLAAIRVFARFVASRAPAYVDWCGLLRAIQAKKAAPQPITWLTKAEMNAVLDVPDRKTPRGRNEYCQGRRETRPKGGAKHCHRGRGGEVVRGGRDSAWGGGSRKRREGVARLEFPEGRPHGRPARRLLHRGVALSDGW